MQRSHFGFVSVLLFPALVAACGASAESDPTDPNGPTPVHVDPKGDDDGDGVPNDRDLCPGTKGGKVDKNGCSADQRDQPVNTTTTGTTTATATTTGGSGGAAGSGGAGGAGGSGGSTNDDSTPKGFTTLILDPHGAHPMVFRTLTQNVTRIDTGYTVKGTVLLQAPGNVNLPVLEASLTFEYGARPEDGLARLKGTAEVPMPSLGFLDNLVETSAPMASVGVDTGDHLASLHAPLAADRKYLYFTYSTALSATAGPVTISSPGGRSLTAILDPSDPFFFVRSDVDGLGPMKNLKEVGFGVSLGGHIPFAPTTTWGLPDGIGRFDGQLYVEATVPLKVADLPLELKGSMVLDIDPDHDQLTPFGQRTASIQAGANGELDVSVDIVPDIATFQFPLGNASFGAKLGASGQSAYLSGILHPDNSFLPSEVPVVSTTDTRVAGYIDRAKLSDSFFRAESDMKVNASHFGALTGLSLSDITTTSASLLIDHSGFQFKGTTRQSIHPLLGFNNEIAVDAFFSGKPANWYIGLAGDMTVSGVGLSAAAKAVVGPLGIHVTGSYATPVGLIAMAGDISRSGVNIEGTASTTFPIVAGKEVLQKITDAVICGTELVTDSAVCGTTIVKDATLCGVHAVTDSAVCGSHIVKDAALCGASYVQNAAECGTSYVTDAAKCGVSTFSDIAHCGWDCVSSIFSHCSCSVANSCSFANSCWAPNSCSVANTCSIANECSVAATCPQAKTCDHKVTIPDFDFGSFNAQVHVRIGTSGLEGDVEGDYCATGSSCTKLAGGRIDVSGAPKACITVPGLGEFCGAF